METKTYQYTVVFEQDEEGAFLASVPALKGCHTWGNTIEESEANVREAIVCYLEGLQQIGREIPIEEKPGASLIRRSIEITQSFRFFLS